MRKPDLVPLLNATQVVERLHAFKLFDLDEKWVSRMADRGNLPYVIVNRHRRFREDVIDLMVADWCLEAG